MSSKHKATAHLLLFLLPLIGYQQEPIDTLTVTYKNTRGCRIGITPTYCWYNHHE